jgi:hypothetical protein
MPAAVVQAKINTGTGPTVSNAEAGIGFGLADAVDAGSSPVTKPTSPGTNYSYYKTLHLGVDTAGTTTISDRKIRMASTPATGLYLFFKDGGTTYTQATSSNKPPDDSGTNGAVPSGYTAMSTSFQTWDATAVSSGTTGRNGNYVIVVFGVGNNYTGSPGPAVSLPNIELQYLES